MLKGEYESTVGQLESFEIGYVEMSYNTNQFNEYFLPYYDFYVYDGDYNEDGVHFKDYTIVRVCALDDYYINNKYLAEQYFWQ